MSDRIGWRSGRIGALVNGIPVAVRKDYVATVVVQWLTIGIGLVLFHLVAKRGSVEGFAYYQIARGAVATGQPLAMMGLGTGLQRFLPRAGAQAAVLARQAFAVQIVVSVALSAAGVLLAGVVSRLLGLTGAPAVAAVIVLLAGNFLCTTAVAALRGTGRVAYANLAWGLGLGVVPVLAFVPADNIQSFLVLQGAGTVVVAFWAIALLRGRRRHSSPALSVEGPSLGLADGRGAPTLGDLLRYGLRRTPGDVALPALFAFPTFAVANAVPGGPDAGYVGFATSAITLICAVFGMLTPVLLPRLSAHFHHSAGDATLHRGLKALPLSAACLATLGAVLLAVSAPALVHGFLGTEFTGAVPILRLGLFAAIPLAVFYAVRPTLDALLEVPVTARLVVGSLVLEVLLTYACRPVLSPAEASIFGLCAAAGALGFGSYLVLLRVTAAWTA
ncbi:lipopolysaccharide biosynthesis protein [Micromonosporaceae bacterium Da 78-11]